MITLMVGLSYVMLASVPALMIFWYKTSMLMMSVQVEGVYA